MTKCLFVMRINIGLVEHMHLVCLRARTSEPCRGRPRRLRAMAEQLWYSTQPHMILVHGTLERTIVEKGSLFESYVLNLPAATSTLDV